MKGLPRRLVFVLALTMAAALWACDFDPEEGRDCSVETGYGCKEGYACVQGACTSTVREGQACRLGEPETGAVPCADGLVCTEEPDGFVCRPPSSTASVCAMDAECEAGLVCRRRNRTADMTCQAPAAFGAYCEAGADCEDGLACRVSDFDATRACSAPAQAGEPCTTTDDCAMGLACASSVCH